MDDANFRHELFAEESQAESCLQFILPESQPFVEDLLKI